MPIKTLDEYLKQATVNATTKQLTTKPKYRIIGFYKETEFQETPIGKIPKRWNISRLEYLALTIYYGVTAKAVEHNTGLKILRTTDIKDYKVDWDSLPYCEITSKVNDIKKYLLRKGDLIVARAGTVGVSVLVDRDFDNVVFGSYLIKVRPKENLVYPKFLHYYFQSHQYWKHISKAQGSTLKNINLGILKSLLVPLPPLEEQWGVAEVLSTVDRAIEASGRLIEKLERLKKALMQELLTKGIGHKEYKQTPIGKIPKQWKIAKVRDLATVVPGFASGKRDKNGIIQLRMDSITTYGFIDKNNYVKVPLRPGIEKYLLRPGDIVLVNTSGSLRHLGKVALFRGEWNRCVYSNHLTRIRVLSKNVVPEWLYYVLYYRYISGYFRLIKVTQAGGQNNIHLDNIRDMLIPLPPLDEQKQIVDILNSVTKWIEFERKRKERLGRIKRGLTNLLLTGRVRVKIVKQEASAYSR